MRHRRANYLPLSPGRAPLPQPSHARTSRAGGSAPAPCAPASSGCGWTGTPPRHPRGRRGTSLRARGLGAPCCVAGAGNKELMRAACCSARTVGTSGASCRSNYRHRQPLPQAAAWPAPAAPDTQRSPGAPHPVQQQTPATVVLSGANGPRMPRASRLRRLGAQHPPYSMMHSCNVQHPPTAWCSRTTHHTACCT